MARKYDQVTMPLRVCDLFNAHAAESAYQRLVDVINSQSTQIQHLIARLTSLEEQNNDFQSTNEATNAQLQALIERMHAMETNCVALERKQQSQTQESQQLQAQVQQKASVTDVTTAFAGIEQTTTRLYRQLADQKANVQLVESMQTAQTQMHDRLQALDQRLECKMDKTDASHLGVVIATIESFASKSKEFESQLTHIQAKINHYDVWTTQYEQTSRAHDQSMRFLCKQLNQKLDSTTFQSFLQTTYQKHVQAQSKQSLVQQTAIQQLKSQWNHQRQWMETNASDWKTHATDHMTTQVQAMRSDLTQLIQKTTVSNRQFDAIVSELRCELQCKVWQRDFEAIATQVSQWMTTHWPRIERCMALSAQFVDWFAARGEAHEHNLDVIERHMSRMAATARQAVATREPFSD